MLNTMVLLNGTWALFASLMMMMLGNGLQGTLLGIRGTNEGFDTTTLALISTGYYIGYFSGSFIIPKYIRQVGYIRVFASLVAFSSTAVIIYAMYINLPVWFVMRLLTGFAFAGIYMVAESWLNSQTHNDNRAKVLAVYIIVLYLGLVLGQIVVNFGDVDGYYLFALASIVISLAAVPLLLTKHPTPVILGSSSLGLRKLYKRSPLGVVSSFLANFIISAAIGVSAIYAQSIGMTTKETTIFVSLAYLGCILFQFPIGYLSDRHDRRIIIIVLSALAGVIGLYASIQTENHMLNICFFLLGGLSIPLYAVCIAYVNDRLNPEEVLPATSTLLLVSGLGSLFAPLLVGYFMQTLGSNWFFRLLGIVAVIIASFAIYRSSQSDAVDVEDLGEFNPVGVATTAATLSLATENVQLELDFDSQDEEDED